MPTTPAESFPTHVESAETSGDRPAGRQAGRLRTLLGIGLGTFIEWFEFGLYSIFAPFFARQVFSAVDPAAALLAAFVVFGAGFAIRPFGGWFFGWLADRKGRRVSLLWSVGCASFGTLLIAVVPAYSTVGILAPVILLLARTLQSVAHTGEAGAAYTYISEAAPDNRRALWASSILCFGVGASLVASLIGAGLTSLLSNAQMAAWGWRLPFVLGSLIGLLTLILRRGLEETAAFTQQTRATAARNGRPSLFRGLWQHRVAVGKVFLLMGAGTVFFYSWSVARPAWAISVLHLDPSATYLGSALSDLAFVLFLPVCGALSDRIGRKPNFYLFAIGVAALSFPLEALSRGGSVWQFALAKAIALLVFALVASVTPAVLAELLPTGIRGIGIGIPYAFAAIVFGGLTPYLWTSLDRAGNSSLFLIYASVMAVLGAIVMYFSRETRGIDLSDVPARGAQKDGTP
ncbi:MFS transporter [Amycolatopsis pithecellobii]|uniref:MFS transporter n=1 Tax=Amycolatopsis pithecellobii TaxID=664692 RepID=A0A6N7Z1Y2_9PSEU|nr:MFS transporter [Amycolatopsis pithecellobii]MTD55523.1 MFS transporter [Amycolatopsis pithecellobii]